MHKSEPALPYWHCYPEGLSRDMRAVIKCTQRCRDICCTAVSCTAAAPYMNVHYGCKCVKQNTLDVAVCSMVCICSDAQHTSSAVATAAAGLLVYPCPSAIAPTHIRGLSLSFLHLLSCCAHHLGNPAARDGSLLHSHCCHPHAPQSEGQAPACTHQLACTDRLIHFECHCNRMGRAWD